VRPVPLAPRATADDLAAHRAFVATLGPNAIWREYLAEADDAVPAVPAAVIAAVAPQPAVATHP
jgi:DNA polymerase III subunit epsilon